MKSGSFKRALTCGFPLFWERKRKHRLYSVHSIRLQEDLEFAFVDEDSLTATANTSTVGPGYHIYVCDILHKLGKHFDFRWDDTAEDYGDETGYFHTGDQKKVFAEMTAWLQGVTEMFFNGTLASGTVRLAMPMDIGYGNDDRAITPMGPRDEDWLKRTSQDGARGQDFFAWWNLGLDAGYFLGRALASMGVDVRWRAPINDYERDTLQYVSDSLSTAYKLDASLSYPWAEWAEILGLLGVESPEHSFVRERAGGISPIIGYRRSNVTIQMPGNWWITLPGAFGNFLPEGEALLARDPPREIWYSGYRFADDPASSFAHWRSEMLQMAGDIVEEKQDYIASASIAAKTTENGEEYFALTSSNICGIGRSVVTVIFVQPEDREWAIGVWKSLAPPKAQ